MEIIDDFLFFDKPSCAVLFEGQIYVSFKDQLHSLEDRVRSGDEPPFNQVLKEERDLIVYVSKDGTCIIPGTRRP